MTRDPKKALQTPIVTPNTLWTTDNPRAYGGQPLAEHPNLELARYDATGDGRVDDARWSGALGAIPTKADVVLDLIRANSLWPLLSGLACCAIEMMAAGAGRYDLARFGMEVFRASPRQADLMIVAGRVSNKMAPVLRQIYDQMAAPKWVIAMGACASSGGMFNNYAIVQGVDHVVPVDIYLPGCPPRPEMLMDAILKLHDQIYDEKLGPNREKVIKEVEAAAMAAVPTHQLKGLLA